MRPQTTGIAAFRFFADGHGGIRRAENGVVFGGANAARFQPAMGASDRATAQAVSDVGRRCYWIADSRLDFSGSDSFPVRRILAFIRPACATGWRSPNESSIRISG